VAHEIGQLLGKYKLTAKIGSGAFGSVWLAEDTWLSKRVALKIPHNQDQDFSKLMEEPKLLATMDHPNIIKLFTVEKADSTIFMVMEFVEGANLKDKMAKGRMPLDEALGITLEILSGLSYAHQKGLVHRDMKPANILMTGKGQVKITDFGTAHAIETGGETIAAGTLFYMPKEQLVGRVIPASDLYSVAVMMYEMMTGKLPFFDDNGTKLIQKIMSGAPAPDAASVNHDIPLQLSAIIRRGMSSDLRIRYSRAEDFISALKAFREGKPVEEAPAPPPPPLAAYETLSRKVPKLVETLNLSHEFAFVKALGTRGRTKGQFLLPSALAFGPEGVVYVADAIRAAIIAYDREGLFDGCWGHEGGVMEGDITFHNPSAVAVDRDGQIYVADTKNSRIVIFNRASEIIKQFGRPVVVMGIHEEQKGIIGFNYPRGMAIDEEGGLLYVADTGNNRLRLFTMGGMPVSVFGGLGDRTGEFNTPLGLAVGPAGRLYVTDSQNYRIQVFERSFRFVESIGKKGGGPGEFSRPPVSVFATIGGELMVCDDTDRIHVFGEDGKFLGNISGPRNLLPIPKYFAVAMRDSNDLFAVDENGCTVHCFNYREKAR
jgi:serine/threonine-protein kinase